MNERLLAQANEWSEIWWPAIWRASWQGALFVAMVWVICRFARSLPAPTRYWLWWFASVQWIVRLAFVAPLALPILPAQPKSLDFVSTAPAYTAPMPAIQSPIVTAAPPIVSQAEQFPTEAAAPDPVKPSAATLGMAAWLVGIMGWLGFSSRRLAKTRKLIRRSRSLVGSPIADLVAVLCAERGIRTPDVREVSRAVSPMLTGWIRPKILLPEGFADREEGAEFEMALVHELAHLRRHDLWLGIAPALAHLLFFFHPLAWLAAQEAAAAREESCDIEALTVRGGSPAAYARLLVDTAQANASVAALGAAFGYRQLQRRINMLNRSLRTGSGRYGRAASAFLVVAAVCALPWTVTAQTASAKPKTNQKAKTTQSSRSHTTRVKAGVATGRALRETVVGVATGQMVPAQRAGTSVTAATIAVGRNSSAATVRTGTAVSVTGSAAAVRAGTTTASGIVGGVAAQEANVGSAATATRVSASGTYGQVATTRNANASGRGQWAGTTTAQGGGLGGTAFGATAAVGHGVSTSSAGGGFGGGSSNGTTGAVAGRMPGFGGQAATGGFPRGGGGFGGGSNVASANRVPGFGGQAVGGGFPGSAGGLGGNALPPGETVAQVSEAGQPGDLRFTVKYKNVDLQTALTELFRAAGINYSIKSTVAPDVVTCSMKDMRPLEILKVILDSARQPLTYRLEGGVVYVLPSQSQQSIGD